MHLISNQPCSTGVMHEADDAYSFSGVKLSIRSFVLFNYSILITVLELSLHSNLILPIYLTEYKLILTALD